MQNKIKEREKSRSFFAGRPGVRPLHNSKNIPKKYQKQKNDFLKTLIFYKKVLTKKTIIYIIILPKKK